MGAQKKSGGSQFFFFRREGNGPPLSICFLRPCTTLRNGSYLDWNSISLSYFDIFHTKPGDKVYVLSFNSYVKFHAKICISLHCWNINTSRRGGLLFCVNPGTRSLTPNASWGSELRADHSLLPVTHSVFRWLQIVIAAASLSVLFAVSLSRFSRSTGHIIGLFRDESIQAASYTIRHTTAKPRYDEPKSKPRPTINVL